MPATFQTVYLQATRLLPGERVRVRGTTVGPRGARNCVLVDFLAPMAPEGMEQEMAAWWVTLQLGESGSLRFVWDYGYYIFPDLPCQYAAGRTEPVTLWVTRVRTTEVPVQQPAPEPEQEAEAEEAPAEEPSEQPAAPTEEEEPQEPPAETPAQ